MRLGGFRTSGAREYGHNRFPGALGRYKGPAQKANLGSLRGRSLSNSIVTESDGCVSRSTGVALKSAQARAVYDRIGRVQDWQFYEDRAIAQLLAACALPTAQALFEFGCGTGRLAVQMLELLPPTAHYLGVDVSPVMVALASNRLAAWGDRAQARLVDGSMPLPAEGNSADRIVCTYVFDLLDDTDMEAALSEFERILTPEGLLCLVSLRPGITRFERSVSRLWTMAWRRAPQLLGGCRPIRLEDVLGRRWTIRHQRVVHSWGLVSEVVVAAPPPISPPSVSSG